ncbi:hypothetical protein PCC7418_2752 [Halothece sp. PCC 7418]|uniref:hypothetical protein n=1 Tax=Halothece sp. (strain PCC 7418) TaxID=65093 RepID=UPI0002A08D3F|nr:hypothetical protein [Halothece sp. PCC 7418]AFZ44890.1 hypothetical protein PCC7418_2752 [Halothece sp. PCC 7418]
MKNLQQLIAPIASATLVVFGFNVLPTQGLPKQDTLFPEETDGTVILDFETDLSGNSLNANTLDDSGQSLDIDGTIGNETVSTTNNNVGLIYQQAGLTITATAPGGGLGTVGLFNSNCTPDGGSSNNTPAATVSCENENGNGNGDNDLATGTGFNPDAGSSPEDPNNSDPNINYTTELQGNLLILEENVGDGEPDDVGAGGTLTLDFQTTQTDFIRARIGSITFVDDASGDFVFNFRDGTNQTVSFDAPDENDLTTVDITNALTNQNNEDKLLDSVDISFSSSGGISTIVYSEYRRVPFEAETSFGIVIAGAYGLYRYYKHKKAAKIKQENEE